MNEAPDTPEMKAVAAFLAASFDSKMSGANMREAMIWSLGRAALAAQPGSVGDGPMQLLVNSVEALNREEDAGWSPDASMQLRRINTAVNWLRAAAPTEAKPAQQDAVDAERYRWLREHNGYSIHDRLFADCPMHKFNDAMLDAAIDAARAAISAKKVGAA